MSIQPGLTLQDLMKYGDRLREVAPHFHWRNAFFEYGAEYDAYNNIARIDDGYFRYECPNPIRRNRVITDNSAKMYEGGLSECKITHAYVLRKVSGIQFHVRTEYHDED